MEEYKVEEALKICDYPNWAFVKVKQQMEMKNRRRLLNRKRTEINVKVW